MAKEVVVDCSTGEVTVQADTFLADKPDPVTLVVPDPLKDYRDALATAAAADSSLSDATKTALQNLLAAMAPAGAS